MNDPTAGIDLSQRLSLTQLWRPAPAVFVMGDRFETGEVQIFQLADVDSSELQPIVVLLEIFDPAYPTKGFYLDGHAITDKYGRFALKVGRDDLLLWARPSPTHLTVYYDHKFELSLLKRVPSSELDQGIPIF
jgi:hypothetical protein